MPGRVCPVNRTGQLAVGENMHGTVSRCTKTACYNQGNGRECWTVTHEDGTRTFEWPNEESAAFAAVLPSRDDVEERHHMSWC